MLSVSLPFRSLAEGTGLGSEPFLETLAERGVGSIELRAVLGGQDAQTVLGAAERVWRRGLLVSVHTAPRSADTAVQDVFGPLQALLRAEQQAQTILVLHPVNGADLFSENRRMLAALSDAIRRDYGGAKLALENNRLMPDRSMGDSAALAACLIREADPTCVGICFDFGHYAWVTRAWEASPLLPPEAFTSRVIHTHIHALAGPDRKYTTHFPLTCGSLPLREYLGSLRGAPVGAFNLELEPERFSDRMSGEEGILGSIEALKTALL